MHVKHVEKIIFGIITVFLVCAGLVGIFLKVQLVHVGEGQQEFVLIPQISSPVVINVPMGWNEYRDEGLGYGFAYPSDWELSPYLPPKGVLQGNRMWLRNGETRILIDPLGGTGALESSNPVEIKTITVNHVTWSHAYLPSEEYHRFTDIDGKTSFQNYPGYFRIHAYLRETPKQEREQVLNTVMKLLETLTLLQ